MTFVSFPDGPGPRGSSTTSPGGGGSAPSRTRLAEGRVRVGLIAGTWLPPSETFIYDQIVRARRTHLFVCVRRRVAGSEESFPYQDLCTLTPTQELAFKWLRQAPHFVRYLRRNEVQLVHAHFGTNGAHALGIVDELDVPLVVSFHGHDVAGLDRRNRYSRRYFQYQVLKARLWRRASLLLCASEDLARRLVDEHGAPAAKVAVHALGVDVDRFPYLKRERPGRSVLSVGRLVEKKGLEYGLRAFARALHFVPAARYRIIGEGPLRQELARQAMEMGIAERVDFLGALSHERVSAEMREADVLLCPSVTARDGDLESGVLVVKEAAATGLPVVGSRHGGIPEIIEQGRTGYLADEKDALALADRLVELLTDQHLRLQMGESAASKIRREFDTAAQNALLETRLLSCLPGKPGRG